MRYLVLFIFFSPGEYVWSKTCNPEKIQSDLYFYQVCSKDASKCEEFYNKHPFSAEFSREVNVNNVLIPQLSHGMIIPKVSAIRSQINAANSAAQNPENWKQYKTGDNLIIRGRDGRTFAGQLLGYANNSSPSFNNGRPFSRFAYIRGVDGVEMVDLSNVNVKPSQKDSSLHMVKSYLGKVGVKRGADILVDGVKYTVDEVGGKVIDDSLEYIYVKGKDGIRRRVKTSKILSYVAKTRVAPSVIAYGSTMLKMGGRLETFASRFLGPAGLILSPDMAACAEVADRYIERCSVQKSKPFLRDWFLALDPSSQRKHLGDGFVCDIIKDFLASKRKQMKSEASEDKSYSGSVLSNLSSCNIQGNNATFTSPRAVVPFMNRLGGEYSYLHTVGRAKNEKGFYRRVRIERFNSDSSRVEFFTEYKFYENTFEPPEVVTSHTREGQPMSFNQETYKNFALESLAYNPIESISCNSSETSSSANSIE